jgi:hypothetical protein
MGHVPPFGEVEDGPVFPGLTRPREGGRQETRLSLAVGSLVERRDQVKALVDPMLDEHRIACEQVADAEYRHEQAEAKAFTQVDGAMELRKRLAILDEEVAKASSDLWEAKMMRRITEKALHVREKDLEFLTAAAHAHNRELKVLGG